MQNYLAIETEVAHRRSEWERAVEADARAAQISTGNGRKPWPQRLLASVRSPATPRLRFSSPLATGRRVAC